MIDNYNPRLDGQKLQVVVETHDIRWQFADQISVTEWYCQLTAKLTATRVYIYDTQNTSVESWKVLLRLDER